jgi:hypothetical protein
MMEIPRTAIATAEQMPLLLEPYLPPLRNPEYRAEAPKQD